jgi:hypothetical protein
MVIHHSPSSANLKGQDEPIQLPDERYSYTPYRVETKPSIRKRPILHSGRVSRRIQSEIRKWRLLCRQKREILRGEPLPVSALEEQFSELTLNPAIPIEPIKLWSPSFFEDDVEL